MYIGLISKWEIPQKFTPKLPSNAPERGKLNSPFIDILVVIKKTYKHWTQSFAMVSLTLSAAQLKHSRTEVTAAAGARRWPWWPRRRRRRPWTGAAAAAAAA